MKRIKSGLSLVIAVVMCLSLLPMTALAADDDFTIENGVLTKYKGSGGAVVIPNGVTSIGDNAFFNCDSLTSITIPDSVTSIGIRAFDSCDSLTSITIPGNVTSFGYSAFGNCDNLTSAIISNGVTSIGKEMFYRCRKLTSVTIGNSVTTIGDDAFHYCDSLASIIIPDSVTSIGAYVFEKCISLTNATIGNGLTSTGRGTFNGCESLTSLTIGNSVTSIDNHAFSYCTSLTSVTIPDGVTSIGMGAFSNCTNLTSVTIPYSVTSIGDGAFGSCKSLASITIPNGAASIGSGVFPKSTTIKSVAGSAVEKYLKGQSYTVEAISGTTPSPDPTPTTPPKTDNAPNLDNASGWAKPFVNEAYNNGLIPSSLQSAYTQATTRAEFCALAVTLYEKIKGTAITDRKTFDDTSDINVEKAAAIGVVSGVGNNKFDPNAKLTREQAAVMLARLAEAVGKPFEQKASTFADNGKIATWAIVQVGQIQAAGIMSGTGNNMFSPQDPYTREQSITTINRMYDVLK